MHSTVFVKSLQPGEKFILPWSGREGELIRIGPGSASVRLETHGERTFTPETGPNAGKEITFSTPAEKTQISLETLVVRL